MHKILIFEHDGPSTFRRRNLISLSVFNLYGRNLPLLSLSPTVGPKYIFRGQWKYKACTCYNIKNFSEPQYLIARLRCFGL